MMIQTGWLGMKAKWGFERDDIWLPPYFDREYLAPRLVRVTVAAPANFMPD